MGDARAVRIRARERYAAAVMLADQSEDHPLRGLEKKKLQAFRNVERLRTGFHLPRRTWYLLGLLIPLVLMAVLGRGIFASIPIGSARESLRQRNLPAAESALEWARWLAPKNGEIALLEARIRRKQGRIEEAMECLKQARELGQEEKAVKREEVMMAAQIGRMHEAEQHLEAILDSPEGDTQEICQAFVSGYILTCRFESAMQMINAWQADFPDDPEPRYMRGLIQKQLKNWQEAEDELLAAVTLDPTHGDAILLLADVLMSREHPQQALDWYQYFRSSQPRHPEAEIGAAKALRILGRPEEARTIIDNLLQQDSSNALAQVEMGELELAAGRYDEAVEWMQQASDRRPNDISILFRLAAALSAAGRPNEALPHFNRAEAAKTALGRVSDLTRQIYSTPNDLAARTELGKILIEQGSTREGVFWLKSVFDFDPHNRQAHEALAGYYESRRSVDPRFAELAAEHRRLAMQSQPPVQNPE